MKKKLLITTLTLTSLLLIGGCGQSKAVETTATVEETAEVTEAEVTPTPEPTVEPTPEPTPEPIIELTDEEILPAANDAFMNAKKFAISEVVTSVGVGDDGTDIVDERKGYVDFDKDVVTISSNTKFQNACANAILTVKGNEQIYFLTDNGWYNGNDFFSNDNDTLMTFASNNSGYYGRIYSPATAICNYDTGYLVAHDWTSDVANSDEYYLLEQFDTSLYDFGFYTYYAYYINKKSLLPEYTSVTSYPVDGTEAQQDENGNIIALSGTPFSIDSCQITYFDDPESQTGDLYNAWIDATSVPSESDLMNKNDAGAFFSEYLNTHPDVHISEALEPLIISQD